MSEFFDNKRSELQEMDAAVAVETLENMQKQLFLWQENPDSMLENYAEIPKEARKKWQALCLEALEFVIKKDIS